MLIFKIGIAKNNHFFNYWHCSSFSGKTLIYVPGFCYGARSNYKVVLDAVMGLFLMSYYGLWHHVGVDVYERKLLNFF